MCLDNPLHVSNHRVRRPHTYNQCGYSIKRKTQSGFDDIHLSLNESTFDDAKARVNTDAPIKQIELMALQAIPCIGQRGKVSQLAFLTVGVGQFSDFLINLGF